MKQSASHILMVRPAAFQYNAETALSNEFQQKIEGYSPEQILEKARLEFDTMVAELTAVKIDVEVVEDTPTPIKPDAIFPNNWFSVGPNGLLTIFPMKNKNRQLEKRRDIIENIKQKYNVENELDLSEYEQKDRALEGTGSIVYDHINKTAYACLSPRTDVELFKSYCNKIGYTPVIFNSYDAKGKLIYHTNVVMCVGSGYVVVGLDTVKDVEERQSLLDAFYRSNLEIVELTDDQIFKHFAGNMLQVESRDGDLYLVMSQRAFRSLLSEQIAQIEKYAKLLPVSIDIIETIGGGSARCMMAEIFPNKK